MAIYNYSNKDIIQIDFQTGSFTDASITNSDLDGLLSSSINWNKTEIRDSNCNDAQFIDTKLSDCTFSRSSLINSQFTKCNLLNNNLSGLSLIKVKILNSKLKKTVFEACTMQRAQFKNTIIDSSTIKDIEGIYASFSNTVFINCFIELTYGNGMNGFSSALFENCLFYNCSFSGYPLRGAKIDHCTFIACSGEITDEIEAECSYGLPRIPIAEASPLTDFNAAQNLINEVTNG